MSPYGAQERSPSLHALSQILSVQKGLRHALKISESCIALFGKLAPLTPGAIQFTQACWVTRKIIRMPELLETAIYFKEWKRNADATYPQAIAMFLIGAITTLDSLKFLEKFFGVQTVSQMPMFGKVSLTNVLLSTLGLGIGPCLFAHGRIKRTRNASKLHEMNLQKQMWAARLQAVKALQSAQDAESVWEQLHQAGSEQQEKLKRDPQWDALLADRHIVPLFQKVQEEETRWTHIESLHQLNRKKALFKTAIGVLETALAIIAMISLLTGAAILAASSTFVLGLALMTSSMRVYQIYDNFKFPAAADKRSRCSAVV